MYCSIGRLSCFSKLIIFSFSANFSHPFWGKIDKKKIISNGKTLIKVFIFLAFNLYFLKFQGKSCTVVYGSNAERWTYDICYYSIKKIITGHHYNLKMFYWHQIYICKARCKGCIVSEKLFSSILYIRLLGNRKMTSGNAWFMINL